MEKKYTIEDFRKLVNVYIHTIVEYAMVFNIDLFTEKYLFKPQNKNLQNGRLITLAFLDCFIPLKAHLKEYEKDKYMLKTPDYIAKKTNTDIDLVINYLENQKQNFDNTDFRGFTENDKLTPETKVKAISSYKIAKDIYTENLEKRLKAYIPK